MPNHLENLTMEQQRIAKLESKVAELQLNNKRLIEQLCYARKKAGIRVPKTSKVKVIDLYETGKSPTECAEMVGCSSRFARKVIAEYKKALN